MREIFDRRAQERTRAVQDDLHHSEETLFSIRGLYYASRSVERSEFKQFVRPSISSWRALTALAWAPRIPDAERQAYEKAARADGQADYQITQQDANGNTVGANRRPSYFPIYFEESPTGVHSQMGLDLASILPYSTAMAKARDTGLPTTALTSTPYGKDINQHGAIVFLPIFKSHATPASVSLRRDDLEGFAVCAFDMQNLVEAAIDRLSPEAIGVSIFDQSGASAAHLLYYHAPRVGSSRMAMQSNSLSLRSMVSAADRRLLVVTSATPEFMAQEDGHRDIMGLLLGLAITAALVGYLFITTRRSTRIESLVHQLATAKEHLECEIVERTHAQEAAEEHLRFLQVMMDAMPFPVFYKDQEAVYRGCNDSFVEYLGFKSKDQVIGKTVYDIAPKELADIYHDGDLAVIRDRTVQIYEGQVDHANGTRHNVVFHKAVFENPDGSIAGLVGAILDITERKKSEEALRESEERHRLLFENMSEGFALCEMLWDENGEPLDFRYLQVNAAWEKQTGLPLAETVGRTASEVIPGIEPYWVETYGRVVRTGQSVKVENYVAGLGRWFEVVASRHSENQFAALFADITERKRAESALIESEQKYRSVVDNIGIGIAVIGRKMEVLSMNNQMRDWNPDVDVSLHPLCYQCFNTPPRDEICEYCPTVQTLQDGEIHEAVTDTPTPDGVKHFRIVSTPLRGADGKVAAAIEMVEDVTERLQSQLELTQAKEAAEDANHAKSQFLANMSHEIRTPMNGISSMTELALDTGLTTEQREYLQMVKDSADSLLHLLNDILDFSKIEAGKLELDPADFNLRDSLMDTVTLLAVRAQRKGLELACHILPDVPDRLIGDMDRIRQVIVNLIGNAIKFTDNGEVVVRVELEPTEDKSLCLHFTVCDTGIGVPAEKQHAIFGAFAQADGSTTRRYGGTGLGLAISSQLVEMMGGRLWLESEVGKGSTFHFTVNLGVQEPQNAEETGDSPYDLQGMPVLVVEDNATQRHILEEMLANWGLDPVMAEDGGAALSAIEDRIISENSFALIIVDANMPDIDGFTLIEQIRSNPNAGRTGIIMLTSPGVPEETAKCRELSVATCLAKPVKESDLLNAIYSSLGAVQAESGKSSSNHKRIITPALRSLRILVAEDNAINQILATRVIEKYGHVVSVVGNGREALEMSETHAFDIILMDVQMPEMDGYAATAAIREREDGTKVHIPIIAMTAHAMKGDRERCLAAGMDDYVAKPVKADALLAAIERCLPHAVQETNYHPLADNDQAA